MSRRTTNTLGFGLLLLVLAAVAVADDAFLFEDHQSKIVSLAWSSDGKHLASGALDRSARLWDVAARTSREYRAEGRGTAWAVTFRPDGKLLAVSDLDLSIKLVSVPDGAVSATLPADAERGFPVKRLSFSGDNGLLAAGLASGEIWLIDPTAGKVATRIKHQAEINTLAFAPSGRRLAAASLGQLCIWDADSGALAWTIEESGNEFEVRALAWSPDGSRLVVGDAGGAVRFYDAATGKEQAAIQIDSAGVDTVGWSGDGAWVACDARNQVALLDAQTMKPARRSRALDETVGVVAFSPDHQTLAVGYGSQVGGLRVADMESWEGDGGR